jgi:hypothetical protein
MTSPPRRLLGHERPLHIALGRKAESHQRAAVQPQFIARSHREAPEIDGVVLVPEDLAVGAFHTVAITGAAGPDLHAVPTGTERVST